MLAQLDAPIEDLGNGVTYQSKLFPTYRYVAFTVTQSTRATIETWGDRSKQIVFDTPPGITLLILNDFSHAGTMMVTTPYAKGRIDEIYKVTRENRPDTPAFVALVVNARFMASLLSTFLPMMEKGTKVRTNAFYERAKGLTWLEAQVKSVAPHS